MNSRSTTRGLLFSLLTALLIAAAMGVASYSGIAGISPGAFEVVRWIAIALLAAYATIRRSLSAWILVGLAAGAELGYDAPALAMRFQVLGSIFLRLIKVIIAPLLFSTLVVGIAGHGDLKKVGRMGVKALIYFEVVSTLALLIGFFAINISRAGEGVRLPQGTQTQTTSVVTRTASDLILNI